MALVVELAWRVALKWPSQKSQFKDFIGSTLLSLPTLEAALAEPLHRQLYRHLRAAILEKRLPAGSRLPSSRSLAQQLGISRNTVVAALEQLQDEGFLESRHGSGTRIALPSGGVEMPEPDPLPFQNDRRPLSKLGESLSDIEGPGLRGSLLPLAVGVPALDAFPARDWSRLLARRWRRPASALMGQSPAAGFPALRQAIAHHLGGARGVRCEAEQIVIVSGAQQGLDLTTRLLLNPGDLALVEDPGYGGLRGVLAGCGAVAAPVPVDALGFDPALAERLWPEARLACVTPSHQFPTGATMPAERRLALIDWAARVGGWIIEDDYDSDFRYGGRPLASLQGLDQAQRTIYCGSFSKSMFPALRLGFLVVPPDLLEPMLRLRRLADTAPSILPQAAMADFMAEGHYTAHLRRMRQLYGERRDALLTAAKEHFDVTIGEAGTHAIAWLPPHLDDRIVAEEAHRQGMAPHGLSGNRHAPGPPALVLGYGNTPTEQMPGLILRLAALAK